MSAVTGRGDGSVVGGLVGLRIEPNLLRLLTTGREVVLVTGTNGKTTTTRLVAAALGVLGQEVASNTFGANMQAGLVSALGRAPRAHYAVLETDEWHLPAVIQATSPKVIVLLNLSRDQMDRAGEIWLTAHRWRQALAGMPECSVVANADDPLTAWSALGASRVTWVAAGQRWHDDSWCCPHCGSHLCRDELGWRCGECGLAHPVAQWVLSGNSVVDDTGRVRELGLALPGRANASNAVMALAAAAQFGAGTDDALARLRVVHSVAGRYTTVHRRGRKLRLLLAKNPAGWLEAFEVLAPAPAPVLLAVNAQTPDGKDTSWIWDVDYRVLAGRAVVITGERKTDLAVRLEADQLPFDLVSTADEALGAVSGEEIDVIANYTAFQQIRATLGRAM